MKTSLVPNKIVVVTAHPDDLEISCAGTLLRFKELGSEIISVVTVRPSGEVNPNRNERVVSEELMRSKNISGFEYRIFDTDLHDNGRPDLRANNVTMTRLSELLDECDLAILPNPLDYHQEHRITYELAWPIMNKRARTVWLTSTWPYCYHYQSNLFRDISKQWPVKEEMLKCYGSYMGPEEIGKIRNLNAVWGDQIGSGLAEAFTVKLDKGFNG